MPRKKRVKKITGLEPKMVNLYRNIYSGKWKDIMPAELLKLDARFEIHCNNLSRSLRAAKKRVDSYKNHGTSKFT